MAGLNMVGGNSKVETDVLIIEDNVMRWANTIIQISNIAFITTVKLKVSPIHFLSLAVLAYGIFLQINYDEYALAFIIIGVLWIILWIGLAAGEKQKAILSISLNSGLTYNIMFYEKKFLRDVMKQLAALISKPYAQHSLVINIKDSTFGGNASVVGTMNS